jgi:hypothetical protein
LEKLLGAGSVLSAPRGRLAAMTCSIHSDR